MCVKRKVDAQLKETFSFYLSVYLSTVHTAYLFFFSYLSSQTLPYDYDSKTVCIVCDHHLVVINQPQADHQHTHTHTHTLFVWTKYVYNLLHHLVQ